MRQNCRHCELRVERRDDAKCVAEAHDFYDGERVTCAWCGTYRVVAHNYKCNIGMAHNFVDEVGINAEGHDFEKKKRAIKINYSSESEKCSVCGMHKPVSGIAISRMPACLNGQWHTFEVHDRRANDTQVGGSHYVKHGNFQPWDAWWHWNLNAFQGAVIKYVVRYRDKGGVEDLKKARHYLDKLIECEEDSGNHGRAVEGDRGQAAE